MFIVREKDSIKIQWFQCVDIYHQCSGARDGELIMHWGEDYMGGEDIAL